MADEIASDKKRGTISVAIITLNEEANIGRTLKSVAWADEAIVVDSHSTDRTVEIARGMGAKVFVEDWKGFDRQKNSSIAKCTSEWVLMLDADEEIMPELAAEIQKLIRTEPQCRTYKINRRNFFMGRWIRHGGFYPDPKLRLFANGTVWMQPGGGPHADLIFDGPMERLRGDMLHYAYPTLSGYIEHMNRYSTGTIPLVLAKGRTSLGLFSFLVNVVVNPVATFIYNYIVRLGFLDGREGFLYHAYHSGYVSWKYAKAWETARKDMQKAT